MASKFKKRLGFGCGIFTLLGIGFVAGAIFALAVAINIDRKTSNWQSEESKQFVTNHFQKYLHLTPEQREKIEPIIGEGLQKRWQLRRDYNQETDRLFVEEFMPQISEFLTVEQNQKLEKRLAQWRKENGVTGSPATPAAAAPPATPAD